MYRSFATTILDHFMFLSHDEMQQDDNDDVILRGAIFS